MNDNIAIPLISRDNLYQGGLVNRKLNSRLSELSSGTRAHGPTNHSSLMLAQKLLGESNVLEGEVLSDIQNGMSSVDVAHVGLEGMKSMMASMKGVAQSAGNSTSDAEREMLAQQYDMMREQAYLLAKDSNYRGDNVVINTPSYKMPVEFAPKGASTMLVDPVFIDGPVTLVEENTGSKYTVSADGKQISGTETVTTTKQTTTTGVVGNLDNVQLRVRNDNSLDRDHELRQLHSKGDVDGDGVTSEGEGMEIDFVLDNSNGTEDSKGISFSNARIESSVKNLKFLFNTRGNLPDAKAGQTVTTDKGADLDMNIPFGTANGETFNIVIDFKADGVETKDAKFGGFTVGDLKSGQIVSLIDDGSKKDTNKTTTKTISVTERKHVVYNTKGISSHDLDTNDGTVVLNIDGKSRKFRIEGSTGILPSFMFNGFKGSNDVSRAQNNLSNVTSKIDIESMRQAREAHVMEVRHEFTTAKIDILRNGAENQQGIEPFQVVAEIRSLLGTRESSILSVASILGLENTLASRLFVG